MRAQNASMKRLILGAVIAFAVSGKAYAGDPATPAKPADGKVDISDLENKYWAPKDTDFSVVQNRTYTKEKRFFLSLQYGIPVSDSYNAGAYYSFTGNYFISERQGIQINYMRADLHPSSAVSDLANNYASGVYPDHGTNTGYIGAGYNFVPFYSKMSVMGKKIIYFDMAFTPTLGYTMYDQDKLHGDQGQKALTYGLDVTQFFFFTDHVALRVDWKNEWYTQDVVKYSFTNVPTPQNEGDPAGSKLIHDSMLLMGITFYF